MVYGAALIAQCLADLGVQVIFGLPGLPVIDIAQEAMNLGIQFISFRNEQAAVLAASAYGYLTARPGVVICVGGPGVLNTVAGIPHAAANAWPLLILAGSAETHNANKAAFQEMDAINLVSPHCKLALRPPYPHMIPDFIRDAYRAAFFGRPGPTFIDLPANLILGTFKDLERKKLRRIADVPRSMAPEGKIREVVEVLRAAKSPLVVVGKGAAYARAETAIRALVERTHIPFLPTPMGKGILPDSSPLNISAARSTAMREADVVILLGARLNWILSFGLAPKWAPNVKTIQVDISADELGKNGHDASLSLLGDAGLICEQLTAALTNSGWKYDPAQKGAYWQKLKATKTKNEAKARKKAENSKVPMTYEHAFGIIKAEIDRLSPPERGEVVYVSEGANAMDISRSIFTMEFPRTRLDAGTYATMGVGLGYAIASYAAYNYPKPEGQILVANNHSTHGGSAQGGASSQPNPYGGASGSSSIAAPSPHSKKKIIAIEGDSAFGFSMAEIETMCRYRMPILVFVINNSGLYRGDADSRADYTKLQDMTVKGTPMAPTGLSATSLGFETAYEKMAELSGEGAGLGLTVRTPRELGDAVRKGWAWDKGPVVVNVLVDTTKDLVMDFSWLDMAPPGSEKGGVTAAKKKDAKL